MHDCYATYLSCTFCLLNLHCMLPDCIRHFFPTHLSVDVAINRHDLTFRCTFQSEMHHDVWFPAGMNAAVRAVTRMGIFVGAKVYLIYEVGDVLHTGVTDRWFCDSHGCVSLRVIKDWWMEATISNSPTGRVSPTSFNL